MTVSIANNQQNTAQGSNALKGQTTAFDLSVALTSLWMVLGVFIDGWAHANLPETEETFFTPWHGVLYSGFFASAAIIGFAVFFNFMITNNLREAIPSGYGYSFFGVILFLSGGVGDMLWHTFIGIETDIEALYSPTHLLLLFGAFLIATGVVRRAILSKELLRDPKFSLALTLGLTGAISMIIFFTQFSHPYRSETVTMPNTEGDMSYMIDGVVLQGFLFHSLLLVAFIFFAIRSFNLHSALIGMFVSIQLAMTSIMEPTLYLLPAAVISGIAVYLIVKSLRDGPTLSKRLMGGLIPLAVYSLYYINMAVVNGIGWSFDLWSGSLVAVTLVGILTSFVFYSLEE